MTPLISLTPRRLLASLLIAGAAVSPALAGEALSKQDSVRLANCLVYGEEFDWDEFRLETADIERASRRPKPSPASDAAIREFQRYATYPQGCLAEKEDSVRQQLAGQTLHELLNLVSQNTGHPVTPDDLVVSQGEEDCERLEEQAEGRKGAVLETVTDRLGDAIRAHPLLGHPKDAGLRDDTIRWRAYLLGKKRREDGGEAAVEGYVHAFQTMDPRKNFLPTDSKDLPAYYFVDSSHWPERARALFGTIQANDSTPLEFASYLTRRRVWRYVMTGDNESHWLRDASFAYLDLNTVPTLDVTTELRGRAPGPEACAPDLGVAYDYTQLLEDTTTGYHRGFQAMGERLLNKKGGRISSPGSTSFASLIAPHRFSSSDTRSCVGNKPYVHSITVMRDEHGKQILEDRNEGYADAEANYDSVDKGPYWSGFFLNAVQQNANDFTLTDAQKQQILDEKVLDGRFETYATQVDVHLVDACETKWVGVFGAGMSVPDEKILKSKTVWKR